MMVSRASVAQSVCADFRMDEFQAKESTGRIQVGTVKISTTNSKEVKSEENLRKDRLNCPSSIGKDLLPTSASTLISASDKAFLQAWKDGKTSRKLLIQGLYLNALVQAHSYTFEFSHAREEWHWEQANAWCAENDKTDEGNRLVPSNLKTLEQGLASMEARAISKAWVAAGKLDSKMLGKGCKSALDEFIQRANGT